MADSMYRASFTSVATARSSVSRPARASPSSSSARTHARYTGRLSTEGRTRRVSLRLVAATAHTHRWGDIGRRSSYDISLYCRCYMGLKMSTSSATMLPLFQPSHTRHDEPG
jgi:hypothetical protein